MRILMVAGRCQRSAGAVEIARSRLHPHVAAQDEAGSENHIKTDVLPRGSRRGSITMTDERTVLERIGPGA
jgi:hypothetical protein